ncbi:flagellar basal body rod C-terminal domain-containing protein, partial [Rhizobium johnstonii]
IGVGAGRVAGRAGVGDVFRNDAQARRLRLDPSNPAADQKGVVKLPNVNILVEMADMREANRSYDANLQTIKQTRDLISSTIDLLKSQ